MTKKGYFSELKAKKELQKTYGKYNVIKVAIGQFGGDFLIVSKGELIKIIEVKETHKKKYYFNPREKIQIKRIKEFAKEQGVRAELWVYTIFKRAIIKTSRILTEGGGK